MENIKKTIFVLLFLTFRAQAFFCQSDGVNVGHNVSTTFTKTIQVAELSKSVNDIILTDMSSYARCYGCFGLNWEDRMHARELTISSELTALGYKGYLRAFGSTKQFSPMNVCLWPNTNCTRSSKQSDIHFLSLKTIIGIERSEGTGTWSVAKKIPAGTEVARLKTFKTDKFGHDTWYTWVFTLQNDINISANTCNIERYDNAVVLPDVTASDIKTRGEGRYSEIKKEFRYDLNCDPQTRVTIKFEGTPMGTLNHVLKNRLPDNENIGIQILFNDNPMDISSAAIPLTVITSALSKETLKFNAYYYYQGGAVSAGPVSSIATFTLDYF